MKEKRREEKKRSREEKKKNFLIVKTETTIRVIGISQQCEVLCVRVWEPSGQSVATNRLKKKTNCLHNVMRVVMGFQVSHCAPFGGAQPARPGDICNLYMRKFLCPGGAVLTTCMWNTQWKRLASSLVAGFFFAFVVIVPSSFPRISHANPFRAQLKTLAGSIFFFFFGGQMEND